MKTGQNLGRMCTITRSDQWFTHITLRLWQSAADLLSPLLRELQDLTARLEGSELHGSVNDFVEEPPVANVISLDDVPELSQHVDQDPGLVQLGHPGKLEAHLGSVMIRLVDYDGSQVLLRQASPLTLAQECTIHHMITWPLPRRSIYGCADVCAQISCPCLG